MMKKCRNRSKARPGELSGTAKLTRGEVKSLRELHTLLGGTFGKGSRGGISQKRLGELFGISQATVGYILRRETWKDDTQR